MCFFLIYCKWVQKKENPAGVSDYNTLILEFTYGSPLEPAGARGRVASDRRSEPDFTRTGDQDDVSMDKPNSLKLSINSLITN